ncbi:unnamed protein product [Parajaminaea phylloscopi]
MKLTPELLAASQSALNPLGDRELDLRGHKIPAIENLGVTRDQLDTLDLSDNDVLSLSNFPHLDRLAHLFLSNNLISRIEPRLAFAIPRLTSLVLTNNQISSFHQLVPLGKFPMLEFVSLIGNPIARERHYREFVVAKCKSLRVLDFRRIKDKERSLSKSLMQTSDGRPSALAHQLAAPRGAEGEPTAVVTMPLDGQKGLAGRLMTKDERKKIEEAIDRSESLEEIRRLEERLRLGYAVEDISAPTKKRKKTQSQSDAEEEEEEES